MRWVVKSGRKANHRWTWVPVGGVEEEDQRASCAVWQPTGARTQPHHPAPLDLTVFLPDVLTFTPYGQIEQLRVLLY